MLGLGNAHGGHDRAAIWEIWTKLTQENPMESGAIIFEVRMENVGLKLTAETPDNLHRYSN
jgi:hypothetical protein